MWSFGVLVAAEFSPALRPSSLISTRSDPTGADPTGVASTSAEHNVNEVRSRVLLTSSSGGGTDTWSATVPYENIKDEPADIAVQNSKGSIHTPPEKDTPAPMSFTIDFGEVANRATKSKPKLMSQRENSVDKPVALTVDIPVEKPIAFTVDDGSESHVLNNSGNLRDYLPNKMKKGLNSRAAKAKSEKPDSKLEVTNNYVYTLPSFSFELKWVRMPSIFMF